MRETCQQYVARRLSEGWKITKQEGFLVILESPDSIIRPVDLRNDVETLRPNAVGDETSIPVQYPDSTFHWDKVDEVEADEDATYIRGSTVSFRRDLYNLPPHSGSGTINFIKIYFRCKQFVTGEAHAEPSLKSNSTVTDGIDVLLTPSYVTHSQQWSTNPATESDPWTWDDIDALQIGVSLRATYLVHCTQVYVEVDYTPVVVAPTVTTQAADGIGFD